MSIKMVVALDMNNGIGDAEGNLLFDLPKDLRHFRSITSRKNVVMGRKTWESLPVKPLPKRRNYVLTMDEDYIAEGAVVFNTIEEVLDLAKTHDVYVIGGGEIYHQLIDDADELFVTHVHDINHDARVHFPDFGYKEFEIVGTPIKHEKDKDHDQSFSFTHYKRKQNN